MFVIRGVTDSENRRRVTSVSSVAELTNCNGTVTAALLTVNF